MSMNKTSDSMHYYNELARMLGPAPEKRSYDASGLSRALGRGLPDDYARLMEVYGGIASTDEFIRIYPPQPESESPGDYVHGLMGEIVQSSSRYSHVDIERNGERRLVETTYFLQGDPFNILRVGEFPSGDSISLFFDEEIHGWTILTGLGKYWCQFNGGLCEFLVKAIGRQMEFPYIGDWPDPEDENEADVRFVPMDSEFWQNLWE